MVVVRKVGLALATLLVVSIVAFGATNLTGIDVTQVVLGRTITDEQREYFREQQGLDEPAHERYAVWLGNVVTGDLGFSLLARRPVSTILWPRLLRTLALSFAALALALPVALLLGMYAARHRGGWADGLINAGTLTGSALPEFVIAIAVLYLIAVKADLLPPSSSGATYGPVTQQAQAYILPALALAIALVPYLTRMIRAAVAEVLATPYVQAAMLRGVGGTRLLVRHVLPNALGPVVNVVALSLAEILVGAIVVENVFGFPGLGQLAVTSAASQDFAVVQVTVLVAAAGFVFLNLLADSAVVLLNPRLRRRQTPEPERAAP